MTVFEEEQRITRAIDAFIRATNDDRLEWYVDRYTNRWTANLGLEERFKEKYEAKTTDSHLTLIRDLDEVELSVTSDGGRAILGATSITSSMAISNKLKDLLTAVRSSRTFAHEALDRIIDELDG